MNAARTAINVYIKMLWFFALLAVAMNLLELSIDSSLLGVKAFLYIMVVYLIHVTILTGKFDVMGSGTSNPDFKFVMLALGVLLLPLLASAVVAIYIGMQGGNEGQILIGIVVFTLPLVAVWIAVFGVRLPLHVMQRLQPDGAPRKSAENPVGYNLVRILGLNILAGVGVLVLGFALLPLDTIVPPVVSGIIIETYSYLFPCITAAVLTHGFCRANNIPALGLIEKL